MLFWSKLVLTALLDSKNKGICKKRHVFSNMASRHADSSTCFQYVKTQGNILNWENHYISDHNWLVFRIVYRLFVQTTSFQWIKQEQDGQESTRLHWNKASILGAQSIRKIDTWMEDISFHSHLMSQERFNINKHNRFSSLPDLNHNDNTWKLGINPCAPHTLSGSENKAVYCSGLKKNRINLLSDGHEL